MFLRHLSRIFWQIFWGSIPVTLYWKCSVCTPKQPWGLLCELSSFRLDNSSSEDVGGEKPPFAAPTPQNCSTLKIIILAEINRPFFFPLIHLVRSHWHQHLQLKSQKRGWRDEKERRRRKSKAARGGLKNEDGIRREGCENLKTPRWGGAGQCGNLSLSFVCRPSQCVLHSLKQRYKPDRSIHLSDKGPANKKKVVRKNDHSEAN